MERLAGAKALIIWCLGGGTTEVVPFYKTGSARDSALENPIVARVAGNRIQLKTWVDNAGARFQFRAKIWPQTFKPARRALARRWVRVLCVPGIARLRYTVWQFGGTKNMRSPFARLIHSPVSRLAPILLAALVAASAASAQNQGAATAKATDVPSYKAGGTPIAIPPPASNLVETGEDNRAVMEVFVPDQNRLLAAFVLPGDLPRLKSGGDDIFSKYSLVEVPRQGESMDLSAKDFKDLADSVGQQFSAVLDSSTKDVEEELNRRMKTLNLDDPKISFDKPVQLGSFFSKQDAYGLGMIMPVSSKGSTTTMVGGIILLRVKNRMLFAYLYATYKDQETVRWVRKTSEGWADAILAANKE
jgi:hypothetical protein